MRSDEAKRPFGAIFALAAVASGLGFVRPYFLREASTPATIRVPKLLAAIYGEPRRREQWP